MRLSPAAEYAVRGVIVLSGHYGERPVTLETICRERDLSRQYMTKIFALLAKADILMPVRGKHGGYLLSRDPSQITVLEVIEAVEGPIALTFCQHSPPKCDQEDCPLRAVWTELQHIVRGRLGGVTLAECCD